LRPLLEGRGHITESIRILVPVDRNYSSIVCLFIVLLVIVAAFEQFLQLQVQLFVFHFVLLVVGNLMNCQMKG